MTDIAAAVHSLMKRPYIGLISLHLELFQYSKALTNKTQHIRFYADDYFYYFIALSCYLSMTSMTANSFLHQQH